MKQEKIIGMQYTDTAFWNAKANDGLGGYQARFVMVHEGRESEAESIMLAFRSAGGKGTLLRDGVVGLCERQLNERIAQLGGIEGKQQIVAELERGLAHIQRLEAKRLEPQELVPPTDRTRASA